MGHQHGPRFFNCIQTAFFVLFSFIVEERWKTNSSLQSCWKLYITYLYTFAINIYRYIVFVTLLVRSTLCILKAPRPTIKMLYFMEAVEIRVSDWSRANLRQVPLQKNPKVFSFTAKNKRFRSEDTRKRIPNQRII